MTLLDKWQAENEDNGAYAILAGFEKAVRASEFEDAYDQIDLYDQLRLYSLVVDLISEATELAQEEPSQK